MATMTKNTNGRQRRPALCQSLALLLVLASAAASDNSVWAAGAQEKGERPEAKHLPRLMLSAVVIRYDKLSMTITKSQWQQILEEISALGVKTIVIQHHHFVPKQTNGVPGVELDFLPAQALKAENAAGRNNVATAVGISTVTDHSGKTTAPGSNRPVQADGTKKSTAASIKTQAKEKNAASSDATAHSAEETVDASGIILDYADAHKMNVYMGLWLDINWYANLDVMDQLANNLSRSRDDLGKLKVELTSKKANPKLTATEIKDAESEIAVCERGLETVQHELSEKSEYFAATADGQLAGPCLKMAQTLCKIYGKHESFVGWYLPEEIWDAAFSKETISVLNPLLKFIAQHCREYSAPVKRSFVISPYASHLHYDSVEAITEAQKELLRDTGIDELMLQDSVGGLNLKEDEDIAVRLKKHFTAFSRVATALKMKLWAELETFEQTGKVRQPTTIARFEKQFQYSFPYLDKSEPLYAAFDYLHYFSLTDAKYPYAEERAKLYDDYKREFVDGRFTPATVTAEE